MNDDGVYKRERKNFDLYKKQKEFPAYNFALGGFDYNADLQLLSEKYHCGEKSEDEFDLNAYISDYEKRMEDMLSQIAGAGKCKVTLTISEGPENIYASESKTSVDKKNNSEAKEDEKKDSEDKVIIMRDKSGGEKALIQKTLVPKITGAVIICDGADDINISENIINAVSVMLDIKSNKVCVIKKSMD